nr:DDE-type integrase/transposase/recombinase [Klebsiella aerogenes]
MAQEIGRDFSFGAETHAAARGRESQVEEAGCRSEPRQGHAAGCAGKKELTLARLREWVRDQQARYGASERQVCFALRVSRSSFRYCSVAADDSALRLRIREITETRVHYGYRRVHVMLRREDLRDNHKRIYRLYSEQGLSLRLKRPRRNKSAQRRQSQPQGLYPNHVWGMDFVSDALFDGLRLRLLTVIDLYTRECLGNCVGQNLHSTEVAEMLNAIVLRRPLPQLLKTDNGSEFAGKMLGKWVYERELVHVSGGCTVQNRGLAHTL